MHHAASCTVGDNGQQGPLLGLLQRLRCAVLPLRHTARQIVTRATSLPKPSFAHYAYSHYWSLCVQQALLYAIGNEGGRLQTSQRD
jgi:hypothetical protein